MKAEELKGKSVDELQKMLVDLKKEQVNHRFQKAAGQLEKSDVIRKTRRDIARVATQLSLTKLGKAVAPKATTKATKKPAKAKKAAAA
jgi:large subunit ribosomal protein L29